MIRWLAAVGVDMRLKRSVLVLMITAASAIMALALVSYHRSAARASLLIKAPNAGFHAEFKTTPRVINAGEPVDLSFLVKNAKGSTVRFLQFVHEKPLHLLIVSEDLAEFYHIHPELQVDDSYGVRHTFPYGGTYRLYADYTPPGAGTIVEQFNLRVNGPTRPRASLIADTGPTKAVDGLQVTLTSDKPLQAGNDAMLKFALTDERTQRPVTDFQLYLGALGHFVIISEDLRDFIHAHPVKAGEIFDPSQDPSLHVHDPALLAKKLIGPSPSEVSTPTNFPRAGLYKLWAQFQRNGRVIVVPFVVNVAESGSQASHSEAAVPNDAIRINVTSSGYEPSQISVKKGQAIKLAFYRGDGQNCAGTVVFPQLQISKQLPVGQTVVIELTATDAGELTFTCGMGMYKGLLVIN
jgi:plastocyanin